MDLKDSVNLPKTAFPMKANLPQNEPKMLARWDEMRLYERIRQARHGAPIYVLHDGLIVETGTYQDLYQQGGIFAELVHCSQVGAAADKPKTEC